MTATVAELELRARTVELLSGLGECSCADAGCLACRARGLLADLRSVWVRERRWRNSRPPLELFHVAGPVISSREYRRSCPGYVVDQRQACERCGRELARGKFRLFYAPGTAVGELGAGGRAPLLYDATDVPPTARMLACQPVFGCTPPVEYPTPPEHGRGRPPYGWRVEPGVGVVPDQAAREVIERMVLERHDGRSIGDIADGLNRDGVRSREDGTWSASTVARVLRYVGEFGERKRRGKNKPKNQPDNVAPVTGVTRGE